MKRTAIFTILFLVFSQLIFCQIGGPGEPTRGTSTPLDGGLLLGLLAGAAFVAGIVKQQKKKKE